MATKKRRLGTYLCGGEEHQFKFKLNRKIFNKEMAKLSRKNRR